MKIGLSGVIGSFSEEAAIKYAQDEKITHPEYIYLVTVERVLQALDQGEIEIGIFPIENSNGGLVLEAVYAMSQHIFQIKKIFEIDIRMNLMVLPGTKREEIKIIRTHQQAIRQCRMYIKRNLPDLELEETDDTARSAKRLSQGEWDMTTAVICSKRCRDLYGLEILEEGIQDLKFNFTSFIAAEKR